MTQYTTHHNPEHVKEREKAIANGSKHYYLSSSFPETWCTECDFHFGKTPSFHESDSAGMPAHFYMLPRRERKEFLARMESSAHKAFQKLVREHVCTHHGYKECAQCLMLVKNLKTHQKSIACLCTAKSNQMSDQGYMQVGHMMEVFNELLQDDLQTRLSKVSEVEAFDQVNEEFDNEKKLLMKSLGIKYAVSDYSKARNRFGNTLGWLCSLGHLPMWVRRFSSSSRRSRSVRTIKSFQSTYKSCVTSQQLTTQVRQHVWACGSWQKWHHEDSIP